jgi:prevent-host-death family protein
MRTVSAREANQSFSRILSAAANGEEVVITRRGTPVAKLVPVRDEAKAARREAAIRRMLEMLRKGVNLGGNAWPGREVIYDEATGIRPWPR